MRNEADDDFGDVSEDVNNAFPNVAILIVDEHRARLAAEVDDWDAITLLACLSDDPLDWSELKAVWPRHRTPASAEFAADSLPVADTEFESAVASLNDDEPWMVIDFRNKRICCGTANGEMKREACYRSVDGDRPGRVRIHLPPWWEFHIQCQPNQVLEPRLTELKIPACRRDFLWGPALAAGLADLMVTAARNGNLTPDFAARNTSNARYQLTVAVHRDWLMTPRDELDGAIPRSCLHGGIRWLDALEESQRWKISDDQPAVPIPESLATYSNAPMGRSEVCLYFDTCREMIDAGWDWLLANPNRVADETCRPSLAAFLGDVQQIWLNESFEGDCPPIEIIQAERLRVPRVAGIDDEKHVIDCNCPICDMLGSGVFGPRFTSIDGHHLELDDEFAFSLYETREEWEEEQFEFAEMSAAIDEKSNQPTAQHEEASDQAFASVWENSKISDTMKTSPVMGDLTVAFCLADIIGSLEALDDSQLDINSLNQAFRDYRQSSGESRLAASENFKDALEQAAERHPVMISRSADLQSLLDEHARF